MNANLNGLKIAVIGIGISNIATIGYLLKHDLKQLSIFDTRLNPPHIEEMPHGLDIKLGPLNGDILSQYDMLVISPGISLKTEEIAYAIEKGVEVVGDIELFAREINLNYKDVKIIGITGSNGKSTVTALVGHILNMAGFKVVIGANFGNAVFDILSDDIEVYVLELSSFELETTQSLHLTACTILNISEDHLDRYDGDISLYKKAKERIFLNCNYVVVNREDKETYPNDKSKIKASFGFSNENYGTEHISKGHFLTVNQKEYFNTDLLTIFGKHNELNALASIALAKSLNIDDEIIKEALASFVGLDHRCQKVRTLDGIDFFNDSKATNVASTIAAIEGLANKYKNGIYLLVGGIGKGQDFSPLKKYLNKEVKHIYCYGRDAVLFKALSEDKCTQLLNLKMALNNAFEKAPIGSAILLSPSCSSFDQFTGYEERGRIFANMVNNLESKS